MIKPTPYIPLVARTPQDCELLSLQGYCEEEQFRGGWIVRVNAVDRCPMSCGKCNSAGGWATSAPTLPTLAPTPPPTSSCPPPVDLQPECPLWQTMGFCTDADNPTLMAYMVEQCPLSCNVSTFCPGDIRTVTSTTLTTTLPPSSSMPSASPSVAARLTLIAVPTAVSALDAPSFDVTFSWDADRDEIGPVEVVPRVAMIRAFDNESRVSQGNVVWQSPFLLDSPSGVTTITLTFKPTLRPLPPGV